MEYVTSSTSSTSRELKNLKICKKQRNQTQEVKKGCYYTENSKILKDNSKPFGLLLSRVHLMQGDSKTAKKNVERHIRKKTFLIRDLKKI